MHSTSSVDPLASLSESLCSRLDEPGPRYTSYPTADRFVEAFDATAYRQALRQRAEGAQVGGHAPLSIYVHVPFCESVCYYCACNKVVTRRHDLALAYGAALKQEIAMTAEALAMRFAASSTSPAVSQVHFGGGTPTFLSDAALAELIHAIRSQFAWTADAEVSIEVDPRTVSVARLERLRAMGFNRLSLGVQDFDSAVQKAVHREQPFELVRDLMLGARAAGFASINADLIYGLPHQTTASFKRTIEQAAQLRPDRLAVYGYAHLPQRFKPQRRIVEADLPRVSERVAMLSSALRGLQAAGYDHIGMDHFALPGDPLAVAKRQGLLHRNFQGYSTQPDADLIGLGVSAIGRVGATYSQNAKTLPEYYDALRLGQFPVVRGLALQRDDLVRRAVVMAIMCQGEVDFQSIELAHLIRFVVYFKSELEALRNLEAQALVRVHPTFLEVTPLGWYFVRGIAMVFDRYLAADRARERFSRLI